MGKLSVKNLAILTTAECCANNGDKPPKSEWRIGDLATLCGKTTRALRLYEEMGLLPSPMRSQGGFRLYSQDALLRVQWINKLQDLGFTLPEIQELLTTAMQTTQKTHQPKLAMEILQQQFALKKAELNAHIVRLQSLQKELDASLEYIQECTQHCSAGASATLESTLSTLSQNIDLPQYNSCSQCTTQHKSSEPPKLLEGIRASMTTSTKNISSLAKNELVSS